MAVFRVKKNENYSTLSNYHFKDNTLSWKAKGILSNMLALPLDWDYSLAGLTTLAKDGATATTSALKDLEEHGYLKRKPLREKGKIIDWEYTIFECPFAEKPLVENPKVVKPNVENRTQLNTNELSTNELNNNGEQTDTSNDSVKEIINYLNSVIGSNYRYKATVTQRYIKARLNEGFTVDNFKKVIDKKTEEWQGTEMAQYLRPETLFGTKFESYLNAPKKSRKTDAGVHFKNERTYTQEELDGLISNIEDLDFT